MGSELLLLITFPVVAKSDKSAELDTVNFIFVMFSLLYFQINSFIKICLAALAVILSYYPIRALLTYPAPYESFAQQRACNLAEPALLLAGR